MDDNFRRKYTNTIHHLRSNYAPVKRSLLIIKGQILLRDKKIRKVIIYKNINNKFMENIRYFRENFNKEINNLVLNSNLYCDRASPYNFFLERNIY